ncbi:MAG: hypothetical protein E7H89_11935 [Cutibacterium acnes]|nr:hypothetical protein [Cutibacterium acnes]
MALIAVRVATFAVRYEVAKTPTRASNFQALLIASGVLLVAGFLFLAEAVLMLLYEWSVSEWKRAERLGVVLFEGVISDGSQSFSDRCVT